MAGIPDWLCALRPRADWLPRASVGMGVAATVAMNVAAGSRGGLGGALVGAMIPVAFVVALETLIALVRELARRPWGWAWCLGAGLPLAGLAAITGIVSYLHALTVATWTGSTGLVAHLIPLVPDQLILTGSVALVALAVAVKREKVPRPAERPKVDRPKVERHKADRPRGQRGGDTTRAVRVADLVKALPADRVAELAKMSKRDLAAELEVTTWAAELWLREHKQVRLNGVAV